MTSNGRNTTRRAIPSRVGVATSRVSHRNGSSRRGEIDPAYLARPNGPSGTQQVERDERVASGDESVASGDESVASGDEPVAGNAAVYDPAQPERIHGRDT